jgi:FMN phosphatase YigB (HAD superfamily)
MAIRAVVFDIGGVLEITPDLGITRQWEIRLGLAAGELDERMHDAWRGGSIGTITLDDVHRALRARLGLDERQLAAFMANLWREYLGTPNTELIGYVRRLRPRYRTGILSNSFVDDSEACVAGARESGLHAVRYQDNAQAIDEIEALLSSAGTVEAELSHDRTQATRPQLHLLDRPADQ